jgi:RNA polymerase sigma-B factor
MGYFGVNVQKTRVGMIQIEKTARKVELTRLVNRNRLLVRRIATRYAIGGGKSPGEAFHSLERVDLEQEGTIGLIRAWDTFDPDRGVPFRAWATDKIRGYILDAIRDQGRILRLPKDANTEYLAYRRAVRGYTERYGTSPHGEGDRRPYGHDCRAGAQGRNIRPVHG